MKKLIASITLICISIVSLAENFNWQAYAFCTRNNTTGEYSNWEPSSITCTFYIEKGSGTIYIYSDGDQMYTIESAELIPSVGIHFYCNDAKGTRCQVRLLHDSSDDSIQLFVDYTDWSWGYLINEID